MTFVSQSAVSDTDKRFVGYVRVSTKQQEKEGFSLVEQSNALRSFADATAAQLHGIFSDVASAFKSAKRRSGLLQAIREASAASASLLVPSVDRLSRHPDVLEILEGRGVEVVSLAEGEVSREGRLRPLIMRGNETSINISREARISAARRKARGEKLGNTANLAASRRQGTLNNAARADQKVEELLRALQAHPDLEMATLNERVRRLNGLGVLNRTFRDDPGKPWTPEALRKPWAKVLPLRAEREDDLPTKESLRCKNPQSPPAGSEIVLPGPVPSEARSDTSRPLTATERDKLGRIMATEGLSTSEVMDCLKLSRRDGSLWMSMRRDTNLSPK